MLEFLGLEAISFGNLWLYMFMLAGLLSLIRAGLGPSFADRYLGIGAFINIVTLLLVVNAIDMGSQFHLDVAMLLVMLSFVGSLAIAKYAPRREQPKKEKSGVQEVRA